MTERIKNLNELDDDELQEMLQQLRSARKKGYEVPIKARSAKNPYANIDPQTAKKILEELHAKVLKAGKE